MLRLGWVLARGTTGTFSVLKRNQPTLNTATTTQMGSLRHFREFWHQTREEVTTARAAMAAEEGGTLVEKTIGIFITVINAEHEQILVFVEQERQQLQLEQIQKFHKKRLKEDQRHRN